MKPVVHLSNAKKLQLEWAWSTPALNGDTRLLTTLPADGAYTVSLHDAEYAGQSPGAFRLKIDFGGVRPEDLKLYALYVTADGD